jgi:hypothetical protein
MAKQVTRKPIKSRSTSKSKLNPKTPASTRAQPTKTKTSAAKSKAVPTDDKRTYVNFAELVRILALVKEHDQSTQLEALTSSDAHKIRMPLKTINTIKDLVSGHQEMRESSTGKWILAEAIGTGGAHPGCPLGFCPGR